MGYADKGYEWYESSEDTDQHTLDDAALRRTGEGGALYLYEHEFGNRLKRGAVLRTRVDLENLGALGSNWSDRVSSVYNHSAHRVKLFEDADFEGASFVLEPGASHSFLANRIEKSGTLSTGLTKIMPVDLAVDWNDRITSVLFVA
ncbi:peptidase inhibitor family I36 protein [Actinokineospora sp. NBRC 105648]|uniref:peptidase inhibitor family I36 protein n=1 Tax=Actinokineospora sp. NBRC 105648 TaxID=3032206 RepID=UPI0024A3650E|nr:peptidase inhibitor family I36 protein [Actinokineospora sp. NBRC 105648]GLZ42058.1 hypothetical protein Acsp05_56820 [Actinokineospora sp. NBRC 105648]